MTFDPKKAIKNKQRTKSTFQKKENPKTEKHSRFQKAIWMTRTGIENLGALFVTCQDVQKRPKIRYFRTIYKNSFTLFFAKFLHP